MIRSFLIAIVFIFSLLVFNLRAGAAEPLTHEAVIDAPVADIWNAWTTSEGLESWMAPHVQVDLRIGGTIRSTYSPSGVIGDDSTIENTIISFLPQRMLSIRNTGQPKDFPFKQAIADMWTVILFEPVGEQTKLSITGMGYGDDEQSVKMREFFTAANQQVLDKLKAKFAKTEAPAKDSNNEARILELLHSMVGGDWIHENTRADGTIFRTRSISKLGPDGQSVISKGWLGDASGMMYHGATQVYRQPNQGGGGGGGGVWFHNINEAGAISRGQVTLVNDNTLQWDWNLTSLDGAQQHYRVQMIFTGRDAYTFELSLVAADGSGAQKLIEVPYQRIAEAPAAFKKLK